MAHLQRIAVGLEYQKAGVGRRLWHNGLERLLTHHPQFSADHQAGEKSAKVFGKIFAKIYLEAAATNKKAIRFYESLGFQSIHRRPGYYRIGGQAIDAVLLSLIVNR